MPADKGGLWVEDKLSGFNPGKTDTLFSLSPPWTRQLDWACRAAALHAPNSCISLISASRALMKPLLLIYVYGSSYHTNTLSTRGCTFLKSCDLSHILLISIRNGLFYYYDTFKRQKLIPEEAKGNMCSPFPTACSLTLVLTSQQSNSIQIIFEYRLPIGVLLTESQIM